SAASAVAVLAAVLGPRPDAPTGRLTFRPLQPQPVGPVLLDGLRFAGRSVTVRLSVDGRIETS
ncbi:MAG TPA: hypothetical protein VH298_14265, partial [Jatrophihabitans sp.]|nr:hypothetical protein [Jatrophihabitans sp.]